MSGLKIYTKEGLIERLKEIEKMGFVPIVRHGNHGGIGNTLEDLLGIPENNLPIPNASEWELKTKRLSSSSLVTLFHMEPSPRVFHFVPQVFLLKYGWPHQKAGTHYPESEMSFRQTIHARSRSDRGFMVMVDRLQRKVSVSFDANSVNLRHSAWLEGVRKQVGLQELEPQPYWGFDDLANIAGTKLLNCFYVQAKVKVREGKKWCHFQKVTMFQKFSFFGFLKALDEGRLLVDFDARTGHNHGTKFRIRQDSFSLLYETAASII